MSRWMLVIVLVLTAQFAWSKNLERGPVRGPSRSLDVANPQDENYVLRNGTIALNITNYGMFGNDGPSQNSALDDPCSGEWAPQFEYPEGSGAQYLFQGAVWFGATIVEDGDTIRRVSVGTDGWQNPSINEFHAGKDRIKELSEGPIFLLRQTATAIVFTIPPPRRISSNCRVFGHADRSEFCYQRPYGWSSFSVRHQNLSNRACLVKS
ncbi:MAG: hypothetical protein IPP40_15465 [bacterium]|nr:hypothetical protein [bacterium]